MNGKLFWLGWGQIVSWGTLYYGLTVLAQPMLQETQWPEWLVIGAYSLGLLTWGMMAPRVGRWIDRYGGQYLMTWGSGLAAVAFLLLAFTHHWLTYVLAWLVAGLSMAFTLYDAAFAVVHRLTPHHYRRNIAIITFMGGFASTVFWPLGFYLQTTLGWRDTWLVFASLHVLMMWVHWVILQPSSQPLTNSDTPYEKKKAASDVDAMDVTESSDSNATTSIKHLPGQAWFLWSFSLATIIFAAMSLFVVDTLTHQGYAVEQAVWLATLIGPMQVLGRLVEWRYGGRFSAYWVGLWCFIALCLGMLALAFSSLSGWLGLLFVFMYGIANGVLTLVRGSLPVELYGQASVGALLGHLARPVLITKALTPGVLALALSAGLWFDHMIWLLWVIALMALASYGQLSRMRHKTNH